MDDIKFIYNEKRYEQRSVVSKLKEYNLNGTFIKTYEDIPEDILNEMDNIRNMIANPEDYFLYEEENGKLKITGLNKAMEKSENLIIPEEIYDKTVEKIGDMAFSGNMHISSVTMPDSIIELGVDSFSGCNFLTDVHLSKSITTIPRRCFIASPIENINLENIEVIKDNAFRITNLQEVELQKCHTLESSAFSRCVFLKKIDISNVKNIEERILEECIELEEIKFQESITEIPNRACYYCTKLKNVKLPKGLKEIGEAAFGKCSNLLNIDLPKSLNFIERFAFVESGLESIDIPENVKTIQGAVFRNCKGLKSINIPESIEYIDLNAFHRCENLTSITMSSKTEYHEEAFDFDKRLLIKYNDTQEDINLER